MKFDESESSAGPIFRNPPLDRRALLLGFLIPLALDVKKTDEGSDSTLQLLLVAVSVLSGALYFLLDWLSPDLNHTRSKLRTTTALWWTYIALSPLPVIVWHVGLVNYLKVLLPFVLFGCALTIMMAAERRRLDPAAILDILAWGALLSAAWRVFYATQVGGLSVESIRWQILGPGVPFLIGYGIGGLYLRRRPYLATVALLVGLVCVLLSITRSFVIVGVASILGLVIVDARRRSAFSVLRSTNKLIVILLLVGTISGTIAALARPDFAGAWLSRLFHHQSESGLDITLISRLAEYRGQLDALTQSALTLSLGKGIGAEYASDTTLLQSLPFYVESTNRFAGHSTWIYPFFASGLFIGIVVPFVLLLTLVRGFSIASVNDGRVASRDAVLAFTIYLAYLGQSLTGNIMHERYSGLIMGILSGALLIYAVRGRRDAAL